MRKLTIWAATVNQSMSMYESLLGCHEAPERIGEDQDHGNDKAVNCNGLNHCQADKQRSGNGVCLIRLLGNGTECLHHCFGLAKGWSYGTHGHGQPGHNDGG